MFEQDFEERRKQAISYVVKTTLVNKAERGVAAVIIASGMNKLAAKQLDVYRRYIEPHVGPWRCERCGITLWADSAYIRDEAVDGGEILRCDPSC